jgi:hypothetical protein
VIAWRNALATVDIDLSVWRIHRRIGMSRGLFISAVASADLSGFELYPQLSDAAGDDDLLCGRCRVLDGRPDARRSARAFFITLTGLRKERRQRWRQGLPLPFRAALPLSTGRGTAFRGPPR